MDFRFLKNTSMKRFTIKFGTFLQNKIISKKFSYLVGKKINSFQESNSKRLILLLLVDLDFHAS